MKVEQVSTASNAPASSGRVVPPKQFPDAHQSAAVPSTPTTADRDALNAVRLEEEAAFFPDETSSKSFKSLHQALMFYNDFLSEVVHKESSSSGRLDLSTSTLHELADWLESTSHSSAFSGVASPETALLGLHKAVQSQLPYRKAGMFQN